MPVGQAEGDVRAPQVVIDPKVLARLPDEGEDLPTGGRHRAVSASQAGSTTDVMGRNPVVRSALDDLLRHGKAHLGILARCRCRRWRSPTTGTLYFFNQRQNEIQTAPLRR